MTSVAKALFSGRMLYVFLYGISSGLPLLLIGSTLKAWMKDQNIDLTVIGIFSLTSLPYTVKFLWSPFMDRFVPPFLGRRRGWILICQIGLVAGLAVMSTIDPVAAPLFLGATCFIIAFLAASQDIAIDAYRREILKDEELGLGSSLGVNGYRVGLLLAGAGALAAADQMPWKTVYLLMAGLMAVSTLITFFSPEPDTGIAPPRSLRDAVVLPLREYFLRPHAVEILAFILLFKVGDSMASDMFNPFFLDLGYSKTEIAAIAKLFGFWATILGGLVGGIVILRLGISRCLWIFGLMQMFSTFGFSILGASGSTLTLLTVVVVFENLCTGMATSAYAAFMAALCDRRFTATQYALLSSLMGVPRAILGSTSGYLAKHLGWYGYFLFCTVLHLPGLFLLLRQRKWK